MSRQAAISTMRYMRESLKHLPPDLDEELQLTDAQREKVEAIWRERAEAFEDLRREIHPRYRAELARMETEIAAVLDAEQKQRWQERCVRMREMMPPPPSARPSEASPASK